MQRIRFTAVGIERIKPPNAGREDYADLVVPGLQLRVSESGSKIWSVVYRVAGSGGLGRKGQPVRGPVKRMTLGKHPVVELTKVRGLARAALETADLGEDPAKLRNHQVTERQETAKRTVAVVGGEFLTKYRKRNNTERTWREATGVWTHHILPRIGDLPISDIKRRDIVRLLDDVLETGRPHAANKVLKELRKFFNWCIGRDLVESSPVIGISLPTKETKRDRVLTDAEIAKVWGASGDIGYTFAVGKYEVTQAQWRAVMGNNPSAFKSDQLPVEAVTWYDVLRFVKKLNSMTGKQYRLMIESEWEYVARAGTKTRYHWGDMASHEHANYGKDECCGGLARGRDRWVKTSPVGSFPANRFGVHDMYGNVWEWVAGCWNVDFSDASKDDSARKTWNCSARVARGGSWRSNLEQVRTSTLDRGYDLGFRVARTILP